MGLLRLAHGQPGEDLPEFGGVGTGGHDGVLGSPQLGGGDHFHRFGDLPGVLDRADPLLDILQTWHLSKPFGCAL
jgi:hypothetical protein